MQVSLSILLLLLLLCLLPLPFLSPFLALDSYTFKPQPVRMVNDYKGAAVNAGVMQYLRRVWFADSNAALEKLMQAA
jgi:hypothetical protein